MFDVSSIVLYILWYNAIEILAIDRYIAYNKFIWKYLLYD